MLNLENGNFLEVVIEVCADFCKYVYFSDFRLVKIFFMLYKVSGSYYTILPKTVENLTSTMPRTPLVPIKLVN